MMTFGMVMVEFWGNKKPGAGRWGGRYGRGDRKNRKRRTQPVAIIDRIGAPKWRQAKSTRRTD
jgi:hypothetical protein